MSAAWVIEFDEEPRLWIRDTDGSIIDVTYQRTNAKRFACLEDARHEILHLGLAGMWKPREIGGGS
jgi:hypothetical protein